MQIKQAMTQYSVPVKKSPSQLRKIVEALGKEDINIIGITTEMGLDTGFVRFITERNLVIKRVLDNMSLQVFETPVLCIVIPNRPDELARLIKVLDEQNINIENIYGTAAEVEGPTRLVMAVDKPEKAEPILARLAESHVVLSH